MVTQPKDDWEKPRSKGTHLTDAEIAQLKVAYRAGTRSRDAERTLKCATRTVNKYYGFFKAEGVIKDTERPSPTPRSTSPRFYKSTFEL
ncbi:hypothetical protein [Bradyrhizobium sp. CCBAU 51753]|uniref:hypothetical protein n=1 Tax=Bradyrhizobium sp. CCBAU 51753 TaxID=1325100 RepID=UPI00188AA16D|nr:hypothetical protein [Bradyrhizobium sp. CCBAU 51753]